MPDQSFTNHLAQLYIVCGPLRGVFFSNLMNIEECLLTLKEKFIKLVVLPLLTVSTWNLNIISLRKLHWWHIVQCKIACMRKIKAWSWLLGFYWLFFTSNSFLFICSSDNLSQKNNTEGLHDLGKCLNSSDNIDRSKESMMILFKESHSISILNPKKKKIDFWKLFLAKNFFIKQVQDVFLFYFSWIPSLDKHHQLLCHQTHKPTSSVQLHLALTMKGYVLSYTILLLFV